ncbi:MAG TPA: hypothetical protein VGM54_12940 [Chthoniobacter sp.]
MKDTTPSSDPLSNPRHEAFAREIASGRNATQAYLNVYGTNHRQSGPDHQSGPSARAACTRRVASTGGHRLLRRKSVAARIKSIQQSGAAGVALNLREIHAFLTRVVRTPAGDIAPSSDLCTRVKHLRDGATDLWMPDKLACLRLSAKLQGFLDKASPARPASPARTKSETSEPLPSDPPPILTEERRATLIARRRAAIQASQKQAEEDRISPQKPQVEQSPRVAEEPAPKAQSRNGQTPGTEHSAPSTNVPSVQPAPPNPSAPSTPPAPPVQPRPAHLAWAAYPAPQKPPFPPASRHQHPPSFFRVTPDRSSGIVII